MSNLVEEFLLLNCSLVSFLRGRLLELTGAALEVLISAMDAVIRTSVSSRVSSRLFAAFGWDVGGAFATAFLHHGL